MIPFLLAVAGIVVAAVVGYWVGRATGYHKTLSHYEPFNPAGAYLPPDQHFLAARTVWDRRKLFSGTSYGVVKATDEGLLKDLGSGEELDPMDFSILIPLENYVDGKYNVVENRALKALNKVMNNISGKMGARKPISQADITEMLWAMRCTLRGSRILPK